MARGRTRSGAVQVRCAEIEQNSLTLLTVEGHPLAGALRFTTSSQDDKVIFQIETYTRASNLIDRSAMALVGGQLQSRGWHQAVERVIELSGGSAEEGVEEMGTELLEGDQLLVEQWLRDLTVNLERERHARDTAA